MSVHHASFYAAILANPDDDAPRLAFADQLEREGDAARAEFIRLQCAYDKLPEGEARIAATPPILALMKEHAERWLGPLGAVATGRSFWRGFLDSASGTSAEILAHAEELGRTAPLKVLTVEGPDEDDAPRLAPGFLEIPWLSKLRTLHLGEGMTGPSLAEALAAPSLAQLQYVSLYDGGEIPGAIDELVAAIQPSLKMFTMVGFINTDFDDACAEKLAGSPTVSTLEHLRLWNCNLREVGGAALARSPYLRSLRALDLGLGQYSLNQIGPSGCKALAEAEALPQLRELELDFNEVTDEGWLAMVQSGKLGRFTALRLQKCSLGDASLVPMFSEAPRLDELVTLDLSHNAMGPAGAAALAALAPRSLRNLWLYGNPIGDAGVAALAKAPWLGQLRELNLDLVGMTDAGARALIESPHLDGIEQIVCELQKPALSKATIEALKARLGKRLNRPSIHSLRASQ